MSRLIDLTGQRFGNLVVVRRAPDYREPNGAKAVMWECECDCGNVVEIKAKYLTSGRKKFCGDYCKLKHEDLVGKRFGKLLVVERISSGKWKCVCDCGNERIIVGNKLIRGNNTSCGKCEKTINLIGEKFGKLTVIDKAPERKHENSRPTKMWLCRCDCGNTIICSRQALTSGEKKDCGCVKEGKYLIGKRYGKLVIQKVIRENGKEARVECLCDCGDITTPLLSRVLNNKVHSCGCYRSEKSAQVNTKHGMSDTRLYKVWIGIKKRCYNKNDKAYKDYGERGIKICDEWMGEHGFENFYKWATENGYDKNAPFGECTIDRIDVNGNYEPSNCRFVDMKTQLQNQRKTVKITIDGEELTASEISEKYGIQSCTVRHRIKSGINEKEKLFYKGNLKQLK